MKSAIRLAPMVDERERDAARENRAETVRCSTVVAYHNAYIKTQLLMYANDKKY